MGLIAFIKEAGEKLFGGSEAKAAEDPQALNATAAAAIKTYIEALGLKARDLAIEFDGTQHAVTVRGAAADEATREKIILAAGNVQSVASVHDEMSVDAPADASRYYTVVRGDTLSKIAKEQYGNANDYMKIFEANKPMLAHPDKIYPGQVLRIPAA